MDRSVARRLLAAGLLIGVLAEVVLDGPAYGLNVVDRRGRPARCRLAPSPAWTRSRSARRLAADHGGRPGGLRRRPRRPVHGAGRHDGSACLHGRVAGRLLRAARHPPVGIGRGGDGRDDARGDRGRGRARHPRLPTDGVAALDPGPPRLVTARARPAAGLPDRGHLRDPVRVGGSDLRASHDRPPRLATSISASSPDGSCSSSPVRGSRPGMLSVSAVGIPEVSRSSLGAAARTGIVVPAGRLGASEALVVLVVIDAVVGLFVGLQIAYLFGGQSTLVAAGMTYSDYARRGFFELVAAACLAGAVVVVLEATVARRSRPYLVALLGLLALTAVVLVSAALRLRLYQDAYGWTELRLYVLTTIVSLAVALVLMTGLAVADRMRWLGHGLAVIGVVALRGAERPRALGVRGGTQRRAGHRSGPRRAGRPRGSRRRPTSASCPTMRCRSWSRHSPRCRHGNGRPSWPSSASERPSSRPIRRSPARPPGTSAASGRGRRWRPCHDLTAGSDRRPGALSLADGTSLRTAPRTDARQGRRQPAVRRRLAVRAEVGRLPGARLP